MTISGLGPHGESPSPPERVVLLPEDIRRAKDRDFRVGIAMHTLDGDWSRLLLNGMIGTFGESGVVVTEVIDCKFSPDQQIEALERLSAQDLSVLISLPVANASVAQAHKDISDKGVGLMLLENAPTALIPGKDYGGLISADNFGLGQMAAKALSDFIAPKTKVGVLGFQADFFATNQRELAFARWMERNRPDIELVSTRFDTVEDAGAAGRRMLQEHPDMAGLFVVWDTPAESVLSELSELKIPMTTVDLGKFSATSLASGGAIVGIAGQHPFKQGVAAARTTISQLLGYKIPEWIAIPGVPISRATVLEQYQSIWRTIAPQEIRDAFFANQSDP